MWRIDPDGKVDEIRYVQNAGREDIVAAPVDGCLAVLVHVPGVGWAEVGRFVSDDELPELASAPVFAGRPAAQLMAVCQLLTRWYSVGRLREERVEPLPAAVRRFWGPVLLARFGGAGELVERRLEFYRWLYRSGKLDEKGGESDGGSGFAGADVARAVGCAPAGY